MNDVCNRCIIVINVRTLIRAQFTDHKGMHYEHPDDFTPGFLIKWYEAIMTKSGGDAIFDLDEMINAFIPISTWNGDPVCAAHLYILVEREIRMAEHSH